MSVTLVFSPVVSHTVFVSAGAVEAAPELALSDDVYALGAEGCTGFGALVIGEGEGVDATDVNGVEVRGARIFLAEGISVDKEAY